MSLARTLAVVLLALGAAFGIIFVAAVYGQLEAYLSWRKADATVVEIRVRPLGGNASGNVGLKVGYLEGGSERFGWANESFILGRGADFAREYAVGSRHTVWLDPATERSFVKLGWRLDDAVLPVFLCLVSSCLFWASSYFWRLERNM